MLSHQNKCLKSLLVQENPVQVNRYQEDLTEDDKILIKNACSGFIVQDLRPLNALKCKGLHTLMKTFAFICHKYPGIQHEPAEYMPSTETVARNILIQFKEVQNKLKPMLRDAFSISEVGCGAAICVDVWTDSFRQISYLGATVHFIDDNFFLHSRVIDNKPLDSSQSKTGEYLLEQIKSVLVEYNVDIDLELITFVTDRGANLIKALDKYCRHNDGPHFLHNTVKRIFLSGSPKDLLNCSKELVAHIKHAGLNDLFSPSLKSHVETRWNTVLTVFESIEKNWDKLVEVLAERNEMNYLRNIQRGELIDMIKFLTPFREGTLHMETSKKVTLFWCCVFFKILEKHLNPTTADSALIAEAKANCVQYYLENLLQGKMIQVRHLVAVFLHPSLKSLNKMSPIEKRQVYQEVN